MGLETKKLETIDLVSKSVKHWHHMVETRDVSMLDEIVHSDVIFRSPMVYNPYHGRAALKLVLGTVLNVFEDFKYVRIFSSEDGLSQTLEFSARIEDRELKGVDLIQFDEQGLITEFGVMVRPVTGLVRLGEEMGKRIGAELGNHRHQ